MAKMAEYRVFKEIGSGAFGKVLLAEKRSDPSEKCCIKQIDASKMSGKEQEEIKKEAKMLQKFDHPNIVRYMDFFLEAGKLSIVMELAEDGDLYAKVKAQTASGKRFPEAQVPPPHLPLWPGVGGGGCACSVEEGRGAKRRACSVELCGGV